MAELVPVPFPLLVRRCLEEYRRHKTIFDLPERAFYRGDPTLDTTVEFQGRPAGTPLGPASGPHTQLAQNIVLAWLGGSRIIELKTVQVNDRLTIPRPCIHIPNVGYNVEWSQELRIEESLREYVAGSMLIEILSAAGIPAMRTSPGAAGDAVQLDVSLGYSLEGICSGPVRDFLRRMKDARGEVEALRARIPPEYARFRDLPFRTDIAHNVTLSVFHGCPADEIEGIARFLLTEMEVDVCIKMNPSLLGRDRAEGLLYDRLGYRDLRLNTAAFERDITFDRAAAMVERLRTAVPGRRVSIKFSNTLELLNPAVAQTSDPAPRAGGDACPTGMFREKIIYLSGQPLHVLALHLVALWRERFGAEVPISFSAGADARNFPGLVSLGLVPVSTCTDLLRPGGYGRLSAYMGNLDARMKAVGARNVPDYVLKAGGNGTTALERAFGEVEARRESTATAWPAAASLTARAATARLMGELCGPLGALDIGTTFERGVRGLRDEMRPWTESSGVREYVRDVESVRLRARDIAAILNTEAVVAAATADPRYACDRNREAPRRIDSHLTLFDCLTCDKCIGVCPNDANFSFPLAPVETSFVTLTVRSGRVVEGTPVAFRTHRKRQIANFADACNDCGNCDTYCPETGGPYIEKPRFFGSRTNWERWREKPQPRVATAEGGRVSRGAPVDGAIPADPSLDTPEASNGSTPRATRDYGGGEELHHGRWLDGFFIECVAGEWKILGRIAGREYTLVLLEAGGPARFSGGHIACEFEGIAGRPARVTVSPGAPEGHVLDLSIYCTMRCLLDGMRSEESVNFVNVAWI